MLLNDKPCSNTITAAIPSHDLLVILLKLRSSTSSTSVERFCNKVKISSAPSSHSTLPLNHTCSSTSLWCKAAAPMLLYSKSRTTSLLIVTISMEVTATETTADMRIAWSIKHFYPYSID